MAVNRAHLQVAKTAPKPLLEANHRKEVLKQDKARVRSQILRFESNIQSGSGFTSDICLAMFHVSGLRRDWCVVLVDVHCTNPETTFYVSCAVISHVARCFTRKTVAIYLCDLTSPGVNLSHTPFRPDKAAFYAAKTLLTR